MHPTLRLKSNLRLAAFALGLLIVGCVWIPPAEPSRLRMCGSYWSNESDIVRDLSSLEPGSRRILARGKLGLYQLECTRLGDCALTLSVGGIPLTATGPITSAALDCRALSDERGEPAPGCLALVGREAVVSAVPRAGRAGGPRLVLADAAVCLVQR
jgi:hypothetical protein